jgi:hypothetical protein
MKPFLMTTGVAAVLALASGAAWASHNGLPHGLGGLTAGGGSKPVLSATAPAQPGAGARSRLHTTPAPGVISATAPSGGRQRCRSC